MVRMLPARDVVPPAVRGRVTTGVDWQARRNRLLKRQAKAREQLTYKFAAVASTLAIGSIAVVCTALR